MATYFNTAAGWATANTTLAHLDVGVESDTSRTKTGDGITAWNALVYTSPTSSTATNLSVMSRDANGRSQVATPAAAQDTANKAYVDLQNLTVVDINASGTAATNTWYRATGTITVTLPSAPVDTSDITIENSGTGVVTVSRGGTDVYDNAATSISLNPSEYVELTYRASNSTWYLRRALASNTAGTLVRRDLNGRTMVSDPSLALEVMNRQFQDNKLLATLSSNVTSSSTASTETILLRATIPANSPYFSTTGRPVKIRLFGYSTSTGTLTFRVRAGANGTTSDSTAWTSTTSAAQTSNQRASIDVEAVLPSLTTLLVEGEGTAGTAALGTAIAAPATVTIAPTAVWYIEVTVVCSVASGFVARSGSIIVQ